MLLGDLPIKQFLRKVANVDFNSLQSCVDKYGYGQKILVTIKDEQYYVLPLAHTRQIGALGTYSERWHQIHQEWMKNKDKI